MRLTGLLLLVLSATRVPGFEEGSAGPVQLYTNQWAAHIPGGRQLADEVAADLGYDNLGQVECGLLLLHLLNMHYTLLTLSAVPHSV